MGEGPVQQKALIGPEDTTRFTGGFDGDLHYALKSKAAGDKLDEKRPPETIHFVSSGLDAVLIDHFLCARFKGAFF